MSNVISHSDKGYQSFFSCSNFLPDWQIASELTMTDAFIDCTQRICHVLAELNLAKVAAPNNHGRNEFPRHRAEQRGSSSGIKDPHGSCPAYHSFNAPLFLFAGAGSSLSVNRNSRESSRSTSPASVSGIPTPGGRGLAAGRSSSLGDRKYNSTSASSCTSSSASGE